MLFLLQILKSIWIVQDLSCFDFLPQVQVRTSVLNLSVPDFALDKQDGCAQTLIHCDPSKNFSLTSPYCTKGNVTFLQSCFKPAASRDSAQDALSDNTGTFLKTRFGELRNEVDQMAVYFERDKGRKTQFRVSIRAEVKSDKDVQLIAPLAELFIGDSEDGLKSGIEAKSFRAWANFLLLLDGYVAAQDAEIYAPGGLRVGELIEHPTDRVQVGQSSFPLMCRNNGVWATKNQTLLQGPLNCDGTMQVGGDLILQSEKDQWNYSPEIHVKGDLAFKGSGDFNLLRHVGEIHGLGGDRTSSSNYSAPGTVRVEKSMTAEKPMTFKLYSTSLHTDSSGANVSIRPIDSVGNQEISFPGETPQKDFRSAISNRNPGIMTLQGRGNQGIISSPQLFLVEKKGEFYLATKNPYYFDQKNPIQDLMKKGFQVNTTYITSDMHEAMQREGGFRFHFSLRERFFFNHIDSNNFYDKIKDNIVIHQAGKGLITLPPGQAVFSLSPQFLLKQVQESCQENLMRGYLFEDQPITLDLLADLHKNATEYLTSMGIKLDARNEQQFVDAIKNPKNNNQLPTKPIIFYNQILNEKGIEELKPYFYLPPSLLTQAREQQTGNVFATILGRFPEGTTAEEMVDLLTEKSDTRNSLIQFFKNNPKSMRDITEAAVRSRQKAVEQGTLDKDSVTLQIPIRAPHFALVTDDDLKIDVNLQGKSGVLVAKNGNLTLQSEKTRNHKEGGNFEENVSDQRTLNFQGHLGLRAGKDIETVAVKISADSLQMEAAGNVKDAAIFLDSFEEGHSGNTNETKAQRKAQLTHINVKEDMTVRGHNVVLQGTQVDAGTIQLQAQGGNVSVLGVKEGSEFSKTTKESTGILFWAGEKITSTVHSLVTFVAPQLKARNTVEVEAANQVTLEAPKLEAQETHLKGRQVTFRQGKNISKLSSREKSANPFWMTMDTLEEENENHVQPQIQGQVKIEAEILELEKVKGEVLKYLGKLEYNPDTLKVVHAVLDEMHKRDTTSISAPGPALIAAVAIAVSVATSGAGNALLLGVGMNAATLGSIGATMGSVAISSLTAQVTTQLAVGILAQKSPGDILKKAFNASMLKNVVTSTITAGVLYDVPGAHLAAKNTSEILHRMQTAGAQACVGMGANLAFGDQNLGDALKSGGVQFVSQAASGYLSDRIGKNFADRKDFLDRCAHKVAHGVSAAAFGAAGATALGQDAGTAASGAAMGAMISEIVAESLSKPLESDVAAEMDKHEAELGRPLTEPEGKVIWDSKVADISKIARLTGAVSGVMTGHASGVGAANGAAQTAIGNNFEVTLNNHWQGAWQALRARGNMGLGAVGVGAAATLSGPALFVGSAVALGYALHKISENVDGTDAEVANAGEAGGSREARKKVMQKEGIPTSQQSTSQTRNESGRQYQYEVPKEGGGTKIKSVQEQTLDRSHPGQGHWEAGDVKTDDAGNIRTNKYGAPRLQNSKSKVNYDK